MIRKLDFRDAADAARIHYSNLPEHFLATFGPGFMKALYKILLTSPLIEAYGYFHKDTLEGTIIGTINTSVLLKDIFNKNSFTLTPYIILKLITKPILFPKLLETFFYSKKQTTDIQAELLVLCINEEFRRKGIASQLFKKLSRGFKLGGNTRFKVGVYKDNKGANAFYIQIGGKFLSSFKQYATIWNSYSFTTSEDNDETKTHFNSPAHL